MPRITIAGALLWALLASPAPASAQLTWGGIYVGPDFAAGFRQLTFTVVDSAQPPATSPVVGPLQPGGAIGARVGLLFYVSDRFVVGGDLAVNYFDYHGDYYYGAASDTRALTGGGNGWTVLARAGYPIGSLMPYGGIGLMTLPNSAHVLDGCNTAPCDSALGEGAGKLTARRLMYVIGADLQLTESFVGMPWSARVEWAYINQDPIVNTFSRTVTGPGVPAGTVVPIVITTPMSKGVIRTSISIRLGKR
ncbi:MAG TPA: outer membrane beta-barrel protein [Vicinamibacterales bacterium]|nr:outer membrane beta-barrel protein [Vicinamibacterales bacterium]